MRTNPAIADNVRIRDDGALADNPERQRQIGPVCAEHFHERFLHALFRLVEQLQIDKLRRDFREHEHLATAHLVTDVDGRTHHVVDLAATDKRSDILHDGTAPHKHVAQHRDLVNQGVLDNAVVDHAIVNTCSD